VDWKLSAVLAGTVAVVAKMPRKWIWAVMAETETVRWWSHGNVGVGRQIEKIFK